MAHMSLTMSHGEPSDGIVEGTGDIIRPRCFREALERYAAQSELLPICGGTDLMVQINFDRIRPTFLLDLSSLDELDEWELLDDSTVRIGAGVSYTRVTKELADHCPALAIAARTVGSPQIRNRGTIGGNLATASPAGDSHPALLATRAVVEAESVRGTRLIEIDDFFTGPKRQALEPDELIRAVRVPTARGPQQFSKIGPRNAMVIATASFALALDPIDRSVGTGVGSAGPVPFRAREAEHELESALDSLWDGAGPLPAEVIDRFGAGVSAAASPIDDVRSTADYRRHALRVLARRSLTWVWDEFRATANGATR